MIEWRCINIKIGDIRRFKARTVGGGEVVGVVVGKYESGIYVVDKYGTFQDIKYTLIKGINSVRLPKEVRDEMGQCAKNYRQYKKTRMQVEKAYELGRTAENMHSSNPSEASKRKIEEARAAVDKALAQDSESHMVIQVQKRKMADMHNAVSCHDIMMEMTRRYERLDKSPGKKHYRVFENSHVDMGYKVIVYYIKDMDNFEGIEKIRQHIMNSKHEENKKNPEYAKYFNKVDANTYNFKNIKSGERYTIEENKGIYWEYARTNFKHEVVVSLPESHVSKDVAEEIMQCLV